MPPAVVTEDESSGADIPFKKGKGKNKEKAKAATVNEDDEAEEEEFVVEKIITHRFEADGTLKFQVMWQGWPSSDNTWEPEENLDGCPDEADEYYKAIGGKPVFNATKSKGGPQSKKRKLSEVPISTPTSSTKETGKGRPKKAKKVDEPDTSMAEPSSQSEFPKGSWEEHVISVDTMERDEEGKIYAYLNWKTPEADGKRSRHKSQVVNQKCPQKMLQFYEAHLQFNQMKEYQTQLEPQTTNGGTKQEEEDEEAGIKPVASALSMTT